MPVRTLKIRPVSDSIYNNNNIPKQAFLSENRTNGFDTNTSILFVDLQKFKKDHKADILEKSKAMEDVLKSLNEDGSHLWKVRSPTKWFRRKFTLDLKDMNMRYEPTHKNPCMGRQKRHIELSEIVEIRKGWKTDTFNKLGAEEERKRSKKPDYKANVDEKACFSIIYGPRKDTWDLAAPNSEVAERWVNALQHLVSLHRSAAQEQSYERWLRKQFNSADIDKNKCLSFPETMKLLKHLNIFMDESQAMKLFREANTTRSTRHDTPEVLDEDEFVVFYFNLLKRPELNEIFERYAPAGGALSANGLCQFLQKEQGENFQGITPEECTQLIKIYEQSELKNKGQMSISGFVNMLLSPRFEIFNGKNKIVHQDMNQPLTHYFTASSHNTYLLGNQLSGTSSVDGYMEALKRGCRCVEFDCWDGDNDEPIVYHGYTLTTKILFKEILSDAVKPYAFAASRYPLILSLENHCSDPYQKKIAHHLKTILGDMLYLVDPDENMNFLPSPEELQGKILVKAKKSKSSATISPKISPARPPSSKESVEAEDNDEESESFTTPSPLPVSINVKGVDDGLLSPMDAAPPKASMESLDDSDDSEAEDSIDYIDGVGTSPKRRGVSNDLSSLVNLIQAVHFNSFADSKRYGKCFQMSSFAETKALKYAEELGAEFVDYNKKQFSRIYPGGSRTSSSNFNPIDFWNAGCQIVALNYQTEDDANFFNYSLFQENGSCGYVLKPKILCDPNISFNPRAPLEQNRGLTLTLRLISGQHLPKAPGNSEVVDPYVEIKILGIVQDRVKKQTKVIHNNGFNPVWDETFNFRIKCPELAMLYFRIKDYSQSGTDMQLAHYAIPFSAISTGYRHVHLRTLKGESLAPASLFLHVSLTNYKPIK